MPPANLKGLFRRLNRLMKQTVILQLEKHFDLKKCVVQLVTGISQNTNTYKN